MAHNQDDVFELFDIKAFDTREAEIQAIKGKDIMQYKTKTIVSGPMLESEIYPVWKIPMGGRGKASKPSREAQRNLNNKNAVKRVIRLINTNFDARHIWVTLTYDKGHLPESYEQAKRDIQNYIRRIKRQMAKAGLGELKYIYVTEYAEPGPDVPKKRVHHHIVMNLTDRDMAEKLWHSGGRTQARRLQPDDYGLEGMARYITKDPKGFKRYSCSRNLKQPIVYESMHRFTKRKAEKLASDLDGAKEMFEKMYPKYVFNHLEIRYSQFVSGAYIYAKMRRLN